MTTVSGVSGANAVDASSAAGLDADTLMEYCAAQLNQLNGELKEKLATQSQASGLKDQLNKLKGEIQGNADGAYTADQKTQIMTDACTLLKELPPGSPDYATVAQVAQTFRKSAMHENVDAGPVGNVDEYLKQLPDEVKGAAANIKNQLDQNECDKLCTSLDGVSSNLDNDAQLQMIQIQDLVSKRQLAIQLTTQIMAKFEQGAETVAGNIK